MAPSAIVKHRFQNSLDMIAARSLRTTDRSLQSGTGNAWCIMDSPTLGKMPTGPGRADASLRLEESTMATGSRLTSQAVSVAPLNVRRNVKKIRRRGLVSGVHLDLPPSPMPTPSPPQTSITFTAEWDWNEKSFVFTSFDSSCPLAPTTTHFTRDMASIPVNVDDDYFSHSPALSTPSVYSVSISSPHHPSLSAIETEWDDRSVTSSIASRPMPSPDSASSSPCTPVSEIFDDESFYTHGRKLSQSTVASSVDDLSEGISETQSKTQDALDEFIEELNGSAVPNVIDDRTVDSVRSRKPRNLLLPPLSAYEQLLNRSTELEIKPLSIRRPASASPISRPPRAGRPLPDVPSSANSTLSIYSPDSRSRFSPVSPLDSAWPSRSNSLRQQLQRQLRRTLFNVRPQSKR